MKCALTCKTDIGVQISVFVVVVILSFVCFSQPGSMGLHNLIGKLKKWIKILEEKAKLLPK